MEDSELVSAFEGCTLPASEFTHRNHVRMAWLYLRASPLLEATGRFRESLQRYAASLGAAAKYHETITFAFVFLINDRMQRTAAATFDEFAAANEDLFGPVLERYYRPETLASDLAKQTFLMPDT